MELQMLKCWKDCEADFDEKTMGDHCPVLGAMAAVDFLMFLPQIAESPGRPPRRSAAEIRRLNEFAVFRVEAT